MRASAGFFGPILPWVVGLLRRSLVVAGLLFGFLLAGSALAHAETKPPHPVPVHGIGQIRRLDLPSLPGTITSITNTIPSVTKIVAPVTKVVSTLTTDVTNVTALTTTNVTTLTTDVTNTVVQTITPIVRPAMGMTAPVLAPILPPPPAGSRPPATTQAAAPVPEPTTAAPVAQPVSARPVSAQPAVVPTTAASISVVPPQVWPVEHFVSPSSPGTKLLPAPSPRVPLGGNDPIMDVTGGNSTCGSSPNGPMFGVARPSFGLTTALLAGMGVRPGAGPPKWWFFDPRHHPS
ncbi:MAG TPA: hypothetical protein VGL06_28410 [Pseudonocardiaceae bacterium]